MCPLPITVTLSCKHTSRKHREGKGLPQRTALSMLGTGWFQLRNRADPGVGKNIWSREEKSWKFPIISSPVQAQALVSSLTPGHVGWCFFNTAQPKLSFSWSLRVVTTQRTEEAELKDIGGKQVKKEKKNQLLFLHWRFFATGLNEKHSQPSEVWLA